MAPFKFRYNNYLNFIKIYIINNKLYKIGPNTKYSLDDLLIGIGYVMETGVSWRSLNSPIHNGHFRWQSFYHFFNKLSRMNVFENVYMILLNRYLSTDKSVKLKYLSTDTACIKNEYGSHDSCDFGYTGKKRCCKLSLIVDSGGIPLSVNIDKGSIHDQNMFFGNLNCMFTDIVYNKSNNKSIRYMLADSIYDTRTVRGKLKEFNIKPIIAPNIRRTIDKEKIKAKKLTEAEKLIYKKRIINENCFSWITKNRRLGRRYDKSERNYRGFLFMAFIKIILKRLK